MTPDGPIGPEDPSSAAEGWPGGWIVWRQDDNGNQFEVARRGSRPEADELAATMEARPQQTYWVAEVAQ